jgi:hypothetical protein
VVRMDAIGLNEVTMVVSTEQRLRCYGIAENHILGRRLIPQKGRRRIVNLTIDLFEQQMQLDPDQLTKEDRKAIVDRVKADPEVKQFAIIPIILSAVIGWIIQQLLDSLWSWWKQRQIEKF